MLLKNLSTFLEDPRRRNIVLITLLSLLTILFVGGVRLLTQVRRKGFSGAARIESVGAIQSIPGGAKKPPTKAYARLQMEQNKRAAEQAKQTGRSAIATIVDSFHVNNEPDSINAGVKMAAMQSPLSETEQAIKEHQTFMSEQQTELTKQQLQSAMYQQMNQLFTTWNHSPTQEHGKSDIGDALAVRSAFDRLKQPSILIKAGTILNAILLTEINSDEPSPVLAKITTGEFKGARLIGTLSLTGERLLVQFHSLIPTTSSTLTINALALDEETSKTSLAGLVDRHLLLRYGSLIGSTFLSEYGLRSQKASESTLYDALLANLDPRKYLLSAASNMSAHLGAELSQQINKKATVHVQAGTAIGVLFSADVTGTSLKD